MHWRLGFLFLHFWLGFLGLSSLLLIKAKVSPTVIKAICLDLWWSSTYLLNRNGLLGLSWLLSFELHVLNSVSLEWTYDLVDFDRLLSFLAFLCRLLVFCLIGVVRSGVVNESLPFEEVLLTRWLGRSGSRLSFRGIRLVGLAILLVFGVVLVQFVEQIKHLAKD